MLDALGVSTRGILTLNDRTTTTKTRFIGLAQHRHRQQLIRVDEEINRAIGSDNADRLESFVRGALPGVQAVCLEDYDKGLLTEDICQRVITHAQREGKPVLVDPARGADYRKYRGATILTPNRIEFQMAAGCEDGEVETVKAYAPKLIESCDVGGLLITLDKEGALLALRNKPAELVSTRPRAVYDNTGAGDAVLAMLVAAQVAGATWRQAAELTNIAGGLEVEKFGCVPITRDEIIADLRLSSGQASGKIRSLDDLVAELTLRKSRGDTIAFTNGCFDLLHIGHVRFLEECRKLGTVVVVGVNSDASVQAQGKDPLRPIVPADQRAEVLAALQTVDYVVIFDEPTPEHAISRLNPDVLVKGRDWADRGVLGREHVEGNGGRVVLVPLVEDSSTTAIVQRIRQGAHR
jgi:D-beta-D-heptose 7-phosphate kinase/D-beta-D-heptose 1-phosphate adenosyltransferase